MPCQHHLCIETAGEGHMTNLTEKVARIVATSGVACGTVNVFNVGSTAAVGTIEFEPGLERDLPETLRKLIPPSRDYGHEQTWADGNAHSDRHATLLGASVTVPVGGGKPILGTWQQIIHLECDTQARSRKIIVTVVGE